MNYKFDITLAPVFYNETYPQCRVGCNNDQQDIILKKEQTFSFTTKCNEYSELFVELYGKNDSDSINGRELAIKILNVRVMGIDNEQFIWAGTYTPEYPKLWASQQQQQGNTLKKVIKNTNYLGWNGRWNLHITGMPFTWIHHILNHGWIHPSDHL
mgnify:CR=1 FL=1|jgi:hypothetical protein